MASNLHQRTGVILRRLVRKDAAPAVRRVLLRTRPADIAAAMGFMMGSERRRLYALIDDRDTAAEVLACLTDEAVRDIAQSLTGDQVADLLDRMEPDDATDVVENLPDELRAKVMAGLGHDDDDLASLLSWPSDSAGGIMSPGVFTTPETASCGEAIIRLQELGEDLDAVFYLYLIDSRGRLSGVVSLRALLVHPPTTPLVSVMTTDIITVRPDQDQEEVARVVARYDLLAVPVVNDDAVLLGLITVDDVLDVVREEAAEDLLLMAGLGDDLDSGSRGVLRSARGRFGWLAATAMAGLGADRVIHFMGTDLPLEMLAGMFPVVLGMGGNVGVQSGALAIRGLATGHIAAQGSARFIWRQTRIGVLLGLAYGVLIGLYGYLGAGAPSPMLGVTVGLSVWFTITLGSVLGSSLPIVLGRMGADPAVATGPFVSTGSDLLGIATYLTVARLLLGTG